MGTGTRDLFHWLSALFVFPATAWCVRPFLRSALAALRCKQTNMDVPVTLGVLLTLGAEFMGNHEQRSMRTLMRRLRCCFY